MFYYAQIDGSNKVTGVSQVGAAIVSANMVAIASLDVSLLGKTYNPDDGTFA